MKPTRFDNWPEALAAYIDRKRNEPFEWGVNDCCLFGADWIQICTGLDPAFDLRGKYNSALGAKRIIDKSGGLSVMVASALIPLGFKEVALSIASRGDILVRDSGQGDCAGIVIGSESCFVSREGLRFIPTKLQADARAWRI